MDREKNVGIVGLGKMGIAHMAILNALDGVTVKAVAEKQKLIIKGVKSIMPAVNTYNDYQELLDSEALDAVYITAPTSLHAKMAEDCLKRGINIFIEKPLGVSAKDTRHLVELVRDNEVITMVGYCKHFIDTFRKAKSVLESGILGKAIYFNSYMYISQLFSGGVGWRYKKESSGGGVLNILGTHLVDVLLWFFGDVASVTSAVKSHYSDEVEDFTHSYLTFKSGLAGSFDASWSIRNYRLPEIKIEVQCENGMLAATEDYVKYFIDSEDRFHLVREQDLYTGVDVYVGGPEYTREDAHFMQCVRDNGQPEIDLAYGYKVQCVTDGMYESAEQCRTVEITEH
ncbi:MAG: Gfo/Idh/MocA family oxidoreductase [Actinomycetia bacterium]|nr:Gfo/Idh/MocA family oxidoreductase [Actinomycetes bacterium]